MDREPIEASPAFARHLKRLSLEQLQELGPAIAELEQTPGWRIVTDLLAQERAAQMQALVAVAGSRTDQQYATALGEIRGLTALDAALQTVKKKSVEADQELEQRLAGAAA